MNTTRTRSRAVDAACAAAVDLARAAAADIAQLGEVGDHLGVRADGDRVVTHFFASLKPGYHGWRWAVTVARASRAKHVTVDETVLVPGDEALLAPVWLPWRERLQPGDLGPGDLLPTENDDERLVPGFTASDETDHQMIWEPGLGRARVLSAIGREDAADRWYSGESGPDTPLASAAPAQCSTCGFYVPLAGELKQVFGVCANEYAPDDGRVVSGDHGCGAHSEAEIPNATPEPAPPIVDELEYELVPNPQGPKPTETRSDEAEPSEARPGDAEPVETGSDEAEPSEAQPGETQADEIPSGEAQSGEAESGEAQAGTEQAGTDESERAPAEQVVDAPSGQAKAGEVPSEEAGASEAGAGGAESVEPRSGGTQAAETQPGEPSSEQTGTEQARSGEAQAGEAEFPEARAGEAQADGAQAGEIRSAEAQPGETHAGGVRAGAAQSSGAPAGEVRSDEGQGGAGWSGSGAPLGVG